MKERVQSRSASPIEIDIDTPTPSSNSSGTETLLSNNVLQSRAKDRAREREERLQNGNNPPRLATKRSTGKPINELCARLVIERDEINSVGKVARVFYCVGCDDRRSNNAEARAYPHAIECTVSHHIV